MKERATDEKQSAENIELPTSRWWLIVVLDIVALIIIYLLVGSDIIIFFKDYHSENGLTFMLIVGAIVVPCSIFAMINFIFFKLLANPQKTQK